MPAGRYLLAALALALAANPAVARADKPVNDHWLLAQEISQLPFTADVDLNGSSRELRSFWDCLPDAPWPWTPLSSRYGDVWFSITPAEDLAVIATAKAPGAQPALGIWSAGTAEPERGSCVRQEPGDPATARYSLRGGRSYLFQVGACLDCGAQPLVRFQVLYQASGDLAAHTLSVTRPVTATPAGDAPRPLTRDIRFTAENTGSIDAEAIWRLKACHTHGDNEYCIAIARGTLALAPGETSTIQESWDATGSAGDFEICATLTPFDYVETAWSNNEARRSTWVLVSNIPSESYLNVLTDDFIDCVPYW